jgi:hypothetical protein
MRYFHVCLKPNEREISFADLQGGKTDINTKAGYTKLWLTCHLALLEKPPIDYAWIDTQNQ